MRHGHASSVNGKRTLSPTYQSWQHMVHRCTNPSNSAFHCYGGRGIGVCDRWRTFENFLADMGERPPGLTLDRIDNSKGYEPGNCRWATKRAQSFNRRTNRLEPHEPAQIAWLRSLGYTGPEIAAFYGIYKAQVYITARHARLAGEAP